MLLLAYLVGINYNFLLADVAVNDPSDGSDIDEQRSYDGHASSNSED